MPQGGTRSPLLWSGGNPQDPGTIGLGLLVAQLAEGGTRVCPNLFLLPKKLRQAMPTGQLRPLLIPGAPWEEAWVFTTSAVYRSRPYRARLYALEAPQKEVSAQQR